jgi:hypothetical protein
MSNFAREPIGAKDWTESGGQDCTLSPGFEPEDGEAWMCDSVIGHIGAHDN